MKTIIRRFSIKNNEELVRKIEIDENDERNEKCFNCRKIQS